jgi:hypothetical protein
MAETLREWLQGAPDDRPEPAAWAPNEPMIQAFTEAAKDLTADDVMSVLNDFGVARPQEFTDKAQATACYKALMAKAGKGK